MNIGPALGQDYLSRLPGPLVLLTVPGLLFPALTWLLLAFRQSYTTMPVRMKDFPREQ